MNENDVRQRLAPALSGFSQRPLKEAACHLLEVLGYQSARTLAVDSLSQLQELLDPHDSLTEQTALLSRWRSVHLLFQLSEAEIKAATAGQLTLGMAAPWEAKDVHSYVFFALDLAPRADGTPPTRTELSQITRALNRLVPMPVLVLFRHGDTISLAIINRRKNMKEGTPEDIRTEPIHDRLERVGWAKPLIENEACPLSAIKVWSNRRGGSTHVCVWFDRVNYLVVLAQLTRDYVLKTTYCPESKRRHQLHKEYAAWKKSGARL